MGMFPGQSSESAGRSEERYSRSRCCKSEIAMVPGAKTDTHRIDITVYLAAGRVGRGLFLVEPPIATVFRPVKKNRRNLRL